MPLTGLQTWLDRRLEIIARRRSLQTAWFIEGGTLTGQVLSSQVHVKMWHLLAKKRSVLERNEPEYHGQKFCLFKHLHGVGFKVL